MTVDTLSVQLDARAYDIKIGANLLERAGEFLAPLLARKRTVIVSDENVIAAQGKRLEAGLNGAGVAYDSIVLPAGEATKSFAQLEALSARLLDLNIERGDLILAFGGGVVGDLTGFAAAILRRGCRFAQVPTTLLAQVDSAVGGKTAINTAQGKNLVGAFHQPSLVLADITALETLPPREMRAGYAEIVKYGLISDKAFFEWLEAHGETLLAPGGATERQYAVKTSCAAKAAIVAADEREESARALLNLGHTFGHAFEAAYGYSDRLLHGEAVALGMALAFDYSARQGLCSADDATRVTAHLKKAGLPTHASDLPKNADVSAENITKLMMQDKKIRDGALTLILAEGVGNAFIAHDASPDDIKTFLKEKLAR